MESMRRWDLDFRCIFSLLLCAGMVVCPIQSGAQARQKIDARHSVEPTRALPSIPTLSPTAELSARERIIHRRLQYRQRRTALRQVTRLRRFARIALTNTIKYWSERIDDQHAKLDGSNHSCPMLHWYLRNMRARRQPSWKSIIRLENAH